MRCLQDNTTRADNGAEPLKEDEQMNISRRTLCCAVAAAFTFGTVFGCKSRHEAPGGAATGNNAAPKSKNNMR